MQIYSKFNIYNSQYRQNVLLSKTFLNDRNYINDSFVKSNPINFKSNSSKFKLNKLDDKEFNQKVIKINQNKDFNKLFSKIPLDKTNIQQIEFILNHTKKPNKNNLEPIIKSIEEINDDIVSAPIKHQKNKVLNKFLENYDTVKKTKHLTKCVFDSVYDTDSSESANAKILLIDKLFGRPQILEKYPNLNNNVGAIISYTNDLNCANSGLKILDKMLDKCKKFNDPPCLADNIGWIMYNTTNDKIFKAKSRIIDKVFENPDSLKKYPNYRMKLPKIISIVSSEMDSNNAIKVMDKLFSSEDILKKTKNLSNNVGNIIFKSIFDDNVNDRLSIIDRVINNPENLDKFPKFSSNIGKIILSVDFPLQAKVANEILNNIENFEKYPIYASKTSSIIDSTRSDAKANFAIDVVNRPELFEQYPSYANKISNTILFSINDKNLELSKKALNRPTLLDKFLRNSTPHEFEHIGKVLAFYDENETNKKYIDNANSLSFANSAFFENAFELQVNCDNGLKRFITIENDSNKLLKNELYSYTKNPKIKYSERTFQNNKQSSIAKYNDTSFKDLVSSVETVKSNDGSVLFKEYYVKSKDVKSKYNIYKEEDNKKYQVGFAEKSASGNIIIEKNLKNDFGTRIQYIYIESPIGNRLSHMKIIDKHNNVLLDNKQQFKIIDDNHFVSVENKDKYDIQYSDNNVNVIKNDNEFVTILIDDNSASSGVFSNQLIPILKNLPGSAYFDIDKYGLCKIGKGINNVMVNNAHYDDKNKLISLSSELSNKENLFVLLHELGHYNDHSNSIREDEDLNTIYNKERTHYIKTRSQMELDNEEYFISQYKFNPKGGLSEMIAETNALLYSSNNYDSIKLRGEYFLHHFPETFAKISELLQNGK